MNRRSLKALVKASLPSTVRRQVGGLAQRLRMRRVTSLEQLDLELAAVEKAFARSDAEGRKAFDSFYLEPPQLPDDPYSRAYSDAQFALYERVSGRPYSLSNEASPFDLEGAKRSPFPYQTGSAELVGEQLIAQGFLLKTLNLPPGSSVLEFGPGWGSTTMQFVQMGYRVTAVEIEKQFLELIRHRCAEFEMQPNLVKSDMLSFQTTERFDAVVFFESFHHCADHRQLLRNVKHLLKPGGQLVLASEPVADFPYPWGIRLDGQSLWSMRRYGWLELGFDSAYFLGHLRSEGWEVTRTSEPVLGSMADIIVATR